jgi:hypothetical protein
MDSMSPNFSRSSLGISDYVQSQRNRSRLLRQTRWQRWQAALVTVEGKISDVHVTTGLVGHDDAANHPAAPNPALASWFHAGRLWREVGEPQR